MSVNDYQAVDAKFHEDEEAFQGRNVTSLFNYLKNVDKTYIINITGIFLRAYATSAAVRFDGSRHLMSRHKTVRRPYSKHIQH